MNDAGMETRKSHRSLTSRLTGIAAMIAAIAVSLAGELFQKETLARISVAHSEKLLPIFVLAGLFLCGLGLVLRPDDSAVRREPPRAYATKLFLLVFLLGYTWAFAAWGWLISSFLLIVTLPLIAGYRNIIGIGLTAVVLLGSIYLIFVVGIRAPLP